jgi:uncharacterized membrane protein YebE (DUF533 family)
MTLLRIVAAMAWADGHLAQEEVLVMIDRLSQLFTQDSQQQASLRQELQDYLVQNIPISELIPQLNSQEERELVLKLGYEVIQCSQRTPDEPLVNPEEASAYQNLLQLLNLPPEVVQRLETEAIADLSREAGVIDAVAQQFQAFVQEN